MKNVMIVEDEVIIAIDLKQKLESLDYKVLDVVYDSDKLTDRIKLLKPDMLFLDINIKGSRNGVEMAHIINKDFGIPFIYVTSYTDQQTLTEVKATKPIGYVIKPFTLDDLRVELQMAEDRYNDRQENAFPSIEKLNQNLKVTQKEYDVICDINKGLKNEAIAKKQFISENTVKSHIKRIYAKYNVHSRMELINKIRELHAN